MHFTELIDLVADRLGGEVLAPSDKFFAPGRCRREAPKRRITRQRIEKLIGQ